VTAQDVRPTDSLDRPGARSATRKQQNTTQGGIVSKIRTTLAAAAAAAIAAGALAGLGGSAAASVHRKSNSKPTITIGQYGDAAKNPEPSTGVYGAQAAVKALNKDKSLGFKLKLKLCGTAPGGDTATITGCARDLAADSSVVVMTGSDPSGSAAGAADILDEAGIPCISCDTFTQETMAKSTHWFQTQIGSLGVGGQAALAVQLQDAKSISLPYLDVAGGATLPPLINGAILGPLGVPDAKSIPVPPTAADLSSEVAAVGNPDAVVEALTKDLSVRFTTTMSQQGVKSDVWLPAGVFPASTIKKDLGSVQNKIFVASGYKQSGSGYKQYKKNMKAIGQAGTDQDNLNSIQTWLGVKLIAGIITDLQAKNSDITRETITDAAKADAQVDTFGLTPTLDWTQVGSGSYLGGQVPNVINPWMVGYAWKNGKYSPLEGGKFINVFDAEAPSPQPSK
jgi:ABC-type branched-subunit amino acid transport system substrate-binding protein